MSFFSKIRDFFSAFGSAAKARTQQIVAKEVTKVEPTPATPPSTPPAAPAAPVASVPPVTVTPVAQPATPFVAYDAQIPADKPGAGGVVTIRSQAEEALFLAKYGVDPRGVDFAKIAEANRQKFAGFTPTMTLYLPNDQSELSEKWNEAMRTRGPEGAWLYAQGNFNGSMPDAIGHVRNALLAFDPSVATEVNNSVNWADLRNPGATPTA